MRNEKIKVGQIVPPELRRKVYREIIRIIEKGEPVIKEPEFHIYWLLPCTLWGLAHVGKNGPDDKYWTDSTSHEMFPEWTRSRRLSITFDNSRDQKRIQILKEMIDETK